MEKQRPNLTLERACGAYKIEYHELKKEDAVFKSNFDRGKGVQDLGASGDPGKYQGDIRFGDTHKLKSNEKMKQNYKDMSRSAAKKVKELI